ncbi:anhydro-N-acetylmuramic acid kinase [Pedobacter sp. UYEF25]
MNAQIKNLCHRAAKEEKLIIGLMSGTSMDGLDIALCAVKGSGVNTNIRVIKFTTEAYSNNFRKQLKAIFSKKNADLELVCLMNEHVANIHAKLINGALSNWGFKADDIDFIASHGQTIFHAPKSLHHLPGYPNATLQIGDGDHIAVKTGIITLSDFRQKHVAAGGEGAPLAVYGDYLIFSKSGENRIMLNIGGISNFTYLPGSLEASAVISTDIGPGNTLMDQYMQQHFGKFYDKDATVASAGKANQKLLSALLNHEFFTLNFPKTTGPERFNLDYLLQAQKQSSTETLRQEDVMATLCDFSAEAIGNALNKCMDSGQTVRIFISGGGMHNPLLVDKLKEKIPNTLFNTTAALGIHPDAKEAVLFAILANETLSGKKIDFGNDVPSVFMGKISLPK